MERRESFDQKVTRAKDFFDQKSTITQKKVVIIHGKGQGVLKTEVQDYLKKLNIEQGYKLEFHDASFYEFGFWGATEVIFL